MVAIDPELLHTHDTIRTAIGIFGPETGSQGDVDKPCMRQMLVLSHVLLERSQFGPLQVEHVHHIMSAGVVHPLDARDMPEPDLLVQRSRFLPLRLGRQDYLPRLHAVVLEEEHDLRYSSRQELLPEPKPSEPLLDPEVLHPTKPGIALTFDSPEARALNLPIDLGQLHVMIIEIAADEPSRLLDRGLEVGFREDLDEPRRIHL